MRLSMRPTIFQIMYQVMCQVMCQVMYQIMHQTIIDFVNGVHFCIYIVEIRSLHYIHVCPYFFQD